MTIPFLRPFLALLTQIQFLALTSSLYGSLLLPAPMLALIRASHMRVRLKRLIYCTGLNRLCRSFSRAAFFISTMRFSELMAEIITG